MSAIEETDDRETDDVDPLMGEFTRLKKEIRAAERGRKEWRKEAEKSFDYVAGNQWDENDKRDLESQHRPAVVFNRTAPLVKAVCGLEVNNRQSIIFLPRQQGVTGVNEMITNAGKWVRDECHAEDEESEAFRDTAICGEGWTEMRMDFDDEPNGKIVKERIDPLEMGVNKGAKRANYVDARMVYRIREMDPEDVRAALGLPDDLSDAAIDASKWLEGNDTPEDGGVGNKKDYPETTRDAINSRTALKKIKVVQCQYWRREKMHMVATAGDEEPKQLSANDFVTFQERADQAGLEYDHTEMMKKVFYECFIGIRILDQKPMELGQFTFKAMTGERDRKKGYFYGMVRDMLDPQMWANKWLSQTMHIMNVNAKGGLMAETDAFVNVKKAEEQWSDPTKIIWVKPGSIAKNKIKERTPGQLPAGLDQLMMFAISSIRDVTGINLELLGQADREQAASLEQQRRQSAMTILATLFDSLRKYRKHDGRLLLKFIELLPEGTLVRIVDKGQYQYIPLIKQDTDFDKFDVIIDQAPTSPDQKQFIWGVTSQILQMNILPPPAIIELLKYSPYPESVVQEIRKALGLDGEMPPDQLKQKLQQAEEAIQTLDQELQRMRDEAKTTAEERTIEMLNLQIDDYKAETDRLRAQWDSRIKAADSIAKAADNAANRDANQENAEEDRLANIVTSGEQQLPQINAGGGGASQSALEEKVDALMQMMQQLMGGQPPQPPEGMAPPQEGPPQPEVM